MADVKRREADALAIRAGGTVAQLHSPHPDRAEPGLDQALRPVAVPHDALAPVRQAPILHRDQKCLGFRLHRLGQQPAGAAPQHGRQRVVDLVGLTDGGGRRCYRSAWRIAPSGGPGRFRHPPRYAASITPSPSSRHSSAEGPPINGLP
jgi:hypothetical protein